MIEKLWSAVAPIQLTAAGNSRGLVTVTSTSTFKVKMAVTIANGSNNILLEVKRIINDTQMFLGEKGDIKLRSDLSTFPAGSSIWALEQPRTSIPLQEIERAVYDEEPTVALRTVLVDRLGNKYDNDNPLPVNASVSIGDIQVDVDLDGFSAFNPDSVQITGSQDGTQAGLKFGMVYNRRKQILDSHDRVASFTYADFGTKNQRITQIDYSSPTFPGSIVRRQFSYSLVGNNYKRDNETWTIF